ncbi:MAG: tripartite tricarboxylate transporter substrate binding protein [Burkholderiaceae bacterium]
MTLKIVPRIATTVLALSGLILPWASQAAWPEKTIRMVVPFTPGGNTDTVARIVGSAMSNEVGQTVVIENISGASGTIGANAVAKAPNDGYTMLMGTIGTQSINMSLFKSMSKESLNDFAPITQLTSIPNVLVVNPDLPIKSVADLVEYAKKQSAPLTFASPGVGTSTHLSGEMFKTTVKLPLTHIPYRGSAPALTDVIGGQVHFMFDNLPPALPHIQSGKLRAIAITSKERNPLLPDVPTMIESGFPDFEIGTWNGIVAPAGTPPEVIEKIDAVLQKIASSDDFKQRIEQTGGEVKSEGPEAFAKYIDSEYEKWNAIIEAAGVEKQ